MEYFKTTDLFRHLLTKKIIAESLEWVEQLSDKPYTKITWTGMDNNVYN